MEKPAATEFPVHDLIRNRWSPRAFSDKPVPLDVLRSLFEAARWAASSSNEQPWAFLVATKDDPENSAKMLSVLVEFNAGWAKHAPVLALAVAELAFHHNGNPNRNAFYDVGAASAQLTLEANSRGLFVHQMAGYDLGARRRNRHWLSWRSGISSAASSRAGARPADPQAPHRICHDGPLGAYFSVHSKMISNQGSGPRHA